MWVGVKSQHRPGCPPAGKPVRDDCKRTRERRRIRSHDESYTNSRKFRAGVQVWVWAVHLMCDAAYWDRLRAQSSSQLGVQILQWLLGLRNNPVIPLVTSHKNRNKLTHMHHEAKTAQSHESAQLFGTHTYCSKSNKEVLFHLILYFFFIKGNEILCRSARSVLKQSAISGFESGKFSASLKSKWLSLSVMMIKEKTCA